jgi:hypothetical protein
VIDVAGRPVPTPWLRARLMLDEHPA